MLNARIGAGMARLLAAAALSGFGGFGQGAVVSDQAVRPRSMNNSNARHVGAGKGRDRDVNGIRKGRPGSKLARKAAKGSLGLYGGRRGLVGSDVR